MRIIHLPYFVCLGLISIIATPVSTANASESLHRYIYTSSALIIELRQPAGHVLSFQRYGGFSPRYRIGPYIHPSYAGAKPFPNEQRYSGFKRVYQNQCPRCQRYTGFEKTYSGQQYTGFTSDNSGPRYLIGSYGSIF